MSWVSSWAGLDKELDELDDSSADVLELDNGLDELDDDISALVLEDETDIRDSEELEMLTDELDDSSADVLELDIGVDELDDDISALVLEDEIGMSDSEELEILAILGARISAGQAFDDELERLASCWCCFDFFLLFLFI